MRLALAVCVLLLGAALWAHSSAPAYVTGPQGVSVNVRPQSPSPSVTPAGVRRTLISDGSETATSFAHAAGAAAAAFAGAALVAAVAGDKRSRESSLARRATMVATRPDQAVPWWDRMTRKGVEPGIGIWAEKVNMTQIFVEDNGNHRVVPCTILAVKRGGNYVTDKKWPEKHGFYSVQVGYDQYVPEEWETSGPGATRLATLERAGVPPLKKLREFKMRPQDWVKYEVGQKLWPSDLFEEGDLLDIHGRSKGKGFQGAIARWGHKRGPMGHGSKHHRRYGSVGAGTTPARVLPRKKMPGWGGDHNVTQKSCKLVKMFDRIDEDNMPETIMVVEGSVPGYSSFGDVGGSYVYLHKKKNYSDGRFMRDPVWLWYGKKAEGADPYIPLKGKAWTWKTFWGRDVRWIAHEVKKYWPDGFPGYDHSADPFYDGCDPKEALKAPEW